MSHRRKRRRNGRGATSIAVLLVVAIVGLAFAGMVVTGARDTALTQRRVETVRAFYAAEAGFNMAMRELAIGADEDGDGEVGSISNDGDPGTDPSIGPARVVVVREDVGAEFRLSSEGRNGVSVRRLSGALEQR